MYQSRTIEQAIRQASDFFPVVMVTGPRQVGKTTVFQNCAAENRRYVSLDSMTNRALAQNDPELFLKRFPAPVLIDEVQYAPQLFPYIKAAVDTEQKSGMFWLTGSQQFRLMKNVSESLAGRIGILRLSGFSQKEKDGTPVSPPFLPTRDLLCNRAADTERTYLKALYRSIWKGAFPRLWQSGDENWELFYDSYVQTYIERDVRELSAVSNEMNFLKFMKAAAARTGQLLNCAELANDVGVTQPTVKAWLSVLQTSGLVYLLAPYSNNMTNRIVKTPKLYFTDTGLAAYLTAWKTPETLETGAMNGAFLETYAVCEILKSYWHNGKQPNIYFYRDRDMKEIDVVLENGGALYPVEIKKKTNPDKKDAAAFNVLKKSGLTVAAGSVLCMADTYLPISENANAVPLSYI